MAFVIADRVRETTTTTGTGTITLAGAVANFETFTWVFLRCFMDLKIIVEALTTGGFTDWLWKSLAVCFRNVLNDFDIKKLITKDDNAISR